MRTIICILALFYCHSALADFKTAYGHYLKGHYQLAIPEFQTLANLGHVQSQFMLGQAHESGRGVSASKELAYAWYLLAKDNGYFEAESAFKNIRQKVPSKRKAKQAYLKLKQQTDIDKLSQRLFPIVTDFTLDNTSSIQTIKRVEPELSWSNRNRTAFTLLQFDLDAAGKVESPQVLFSYPDNKTDKAVLSAFKKWQFEPALDSSLLITRSPRQTYLFWLNQEGSEQIKPALNRYLLDEMALGNGLSFYLYALLKRQGLFNPEQNVSAYYLTAGVNGSEHAIEAITRCLLEGSWCSKDNEKAKLWLDILPVGERKSALQNELNQQQLPPYQQRQKMNKELQAFNASTENLNQLDRYLTLLLKGGSKQQAYGLKLAKQAQLSYPDKPVLSKWIIQFHLALGQRQQAQQELAMVKTTGGYPNIVSRSLSRLIGN